MIKEKEYVEFCKEYSCGHEKSTQPIEGQIELSYKCNYDCLHCYSKRLNKKKELNTSQWKRILDDIHNEGTIWLTITGGEPLLRDDFKEIYLYAKNKGFLITVFSNGYLFTDNIIKFFTKNPPYLIEISLNSLKADIYKYITGSPRGALNRIKKAIKKINRNGINLVLKTNALKENKEEIVKIKEFSQELLGRKHFKLDYLIIPKLDGDMAPCRHRLLPAEILELVKSDRDMRIQMHKIFRERNRLLRSAKHLYQCDSWLRKFYITPYGELRFCALTDKYSANLKKIKFREAFYRRSNDILKARFKNKIRCINCNLRAICYWCPSRSFLEKGCEESPIAYYCNLAKTMHSKYGPDIRK